MKLLVIRFSSIGDVVLTTPVLRCIKKQLPGTELHFLTKERYRSILQANPYVDKIITLGLSKTLMMHQLKTEKYDAIIDLHHNLRTWEVKRALKGVLAYSFHKLNWQKWLMTACKINRLPQQHIVDRYLATTSSFGVMNDGEGLDYFIPEEQQVTANDLPLSHQMGYIALVIGAAHATKQLPVERCIELCRLLSLPVILLGGKVDHARGEQIANHDPIKVYNACGKFSLHESADLVRKSLLVITPDTGLMHIAAAFKKPIISIWGNTIPAFGMTPYYGRHQVPQQFSEVQLGCRPCSKIGHDACPKKHFNCMQQQDLQPIQQWVQELLSYAQGSMK
ncbi:MAG: glycosyltransferase family 9 protein [Chitinophagaceae bacterium]|nr:glycosyltransferase family 9 protein [Chitinophagaceae bacterium]